MAEVWQSGDVRLICANCLEVLPTLADGSVDAVITDPPYGVNLRYGGSFCDTADEWLRLVPRVVTWALAGGLFCLTFGSSPTQARDLDAFPRVPDRTLVWTPSFSLSKSQSHGYFYRWHPIYLWNVPKRAQRDTALDCLREPCEGHQWWYHPGTKPVALLVKLMNGYDLGTVLDPFMGSGTTGVACVQTGRRFIGIELSEQFFRIAQKRIAEAQAQGVLPLATRERGAPRKRQPAPLLAGIDGREERC